MATWFSCKPCSTADPTSDVVKINAISLQSENKENDPHNNKGSIPSIGKQAEAEKAQCAEEERQLQIRVARQTEEETARQREVAAAEATAAQEARAREAAVAAAYEDERLHTLQQAEEAARLVREEAEKRRIHSAAAAKKEDELQALAAFNSDLAKTAEWLKKNGFNDIRAQKKKSILGGKHGVLHQAVSQQDASMIGVLLHCGADGSQLNSSGQTAKDVAEKANKKGSHDVVISAFVSRGL